MNADLIGEYENVCSQMKVLVAQGNLAERNKHVPRINELDELIDWGYKVGQIVERRTEHRWVEDVILGIHHNEFRFHSVTMPHQLIRKKTEKLEQMALF